MMNFTREPIITALRDTLEPYPCVLAMWLEGADATGYVDKFSDIDLCYSVEAGALDEVMTLIQKKLESIGILDVIEKRVHGEDFLSASFHLENSSPYLLIDCDLYVNRGNQFITGDPREKPFILFDKVGIVSFSQPDLKEVFKNQSERLQSLSMTVAQVSRIEKYIQRGEFIEAHAYYHKWLLTPLIEVLRMRYTPLHPEYHIVHISRHLPTDVVKWLEGLFKINSLEELAGKIREARLFYDETVRFLQADL
jgi:hypothetical protein